MPTAAARTNVLDAITQSVPRHDVKYVKRKIFSGLISQYEILFFHFHLKLALLFSSGGCDCETADHTSTYAGCFPSIWRSKCETCCGP